MNYKRIHDDIIERAWLRSKLDGEYYEMHHIIPRCLGGDDETENLISLTGREHYLIHWILHKIHPTSDALINAWFAMTYNRYNKRYTSKTFEYARKEYSKVVSRRQKLRVGKLNSFYGKHHTDEFKKYRSIMRTNNQLGEKNFMYNKTFYERWVELYGVKGADKLLKKYKENMRKTCTGVKNGFFGKEHTTETKKVLAEKKKKTYILTSPLGTKYIRKGIVEIAKEFSLHIKTLQRFINKGRIPSPRWKNQPTEKYNTVGWMIEYNNIS